MKIITTTLAALALVACSGDPEELQGAPTNESTSTEVPSDSGAAKAQIVSLKIAGMT